MYDFYEFIQYVVPLVIFLCYFRLPGILDYKKEINLAMNQSGEVSDSTLQHSSIITKRIKGALRCPKSEALYEQVI